MRLLRHLLFTALVAAALFSPSAHAYIGPGGGLSAIGALLALLLGLTIAFIGFVWYPLRRMRRRRRERAGAVDDPERFPPPEV